MAFHSPEQTTNPSLLLRVKDLQDQKAWELFTEIYGPLIFSYLRRRNLQVSDAADVSQEVFAVLSKSLTTFEYQAERGRFRDWLGLITHREMIRFWKRQERANRMQSPVGQTEVESHEDRADWNNHFQSELLQCALNRIQHSFEAETWDIFQRVWVKAESADEVARALNIKIGSVYVAKSRVLKSLRAEVLMLSDDCPILEQSSR